MKLKILLVTLLTSTLIDAQTPDSIWQRSLRRFEQQDFHGVIADMDTLLGLAPVFSNALYNKGIARIKLGDIEGACVDLELAQKMGMLSENRQFIDYMCDPEFIRKIILKQAYKKESVLPELGYRPRYTRADTLRGALRPERTCFDVYFYDLRVKIIPITKRIEGGNTIYFHVVQPRKFRSTCLIITTYRAFSGTAFRWYGIVSSMPCSLTFQGNCLPVKTIILALPTGENPSLHQTRLGMEDLFGNVTGIKNVGLVLPVNTLEPAAGGRIKTI
jgi:hypothetical protein